MWRLLWIVTTASLGVLVGSAGANGRVRTVSCVQVATAVPVPVYVPTPVYTVGYQPDLAALVVLAEEMKALREDTRDVLQQLLQASPQKSAREHPGAALMRRDCAKCHDGTVARAKGKGVVLFERGQFIDTEENRVRAVEQVDQGKMPKDHKWSGQEKYEFLAYHTLRPKDAPPPQAAAADIDKLIVERIDAILKQRLAKPPEPELERRKP